MQRLSEETGEPSKISVAEGDEALVVAAVLGTHEYSPTPVIGLRYPLHAGAASKMILAYLPEAERERLLGQPLLRYSPHTVTDAAALRAELRQIRRQGFARDSGEHRAAVHAIAAPILEPGGTLAGALSIPFLADRDQAVRRRLKDAIIRTAAAISAAIPKVS
jgi:DNA-binding IclR family transcriptional regulator